MSTKTKKINELIDEQQALLNSIKEEALGFDSDLLTRKNEELSDDLNKTRLEAKKLQQENAELKRELDSTKSVLFSKMTEEKLSVFKRRQKELEEIYYKQGVLLSSRLDDYAENCKKSLNDTISVIEGYSKSGFDDILLRLNELKSLAEQRKLSLDQYKAQELENARKTNFSIGESLKNEPLTEYEIKNGAKQKSLESFIGLNILGKAGILLFIIGIIMLGRFAYTHLSDALKGGLIYLLAIALITIGELFHKKEKTVFSTTLMSGGVATLYAACATSYFAFKLYDVKVTFIICMVITAIAIALSNQIKSQIVCGFAAVGGYLPVVAMYMVGFGKASADNTFIPISCVYFCVLAIVLFVMSYNKKWHFSQFIGYGLHLVAIGGVAKCAYTLRLLPGYEAMLPIAAVFAVVSFIIYLLMPASKIISQRLFTAGDLLLLTLNTISGAVSVSVTIRNCITDNDVIVSRAMGYVFLGFAILYTVLLTFSVREKKGEFSSASIITSVSALVFSMLVVPLIFGTEYSAIGWAVEGALLAIISIEKRHKIPEYTGLFCMCLSVFAAYFSFSAFTILSVVTYSILLSSFWLYSIRGLISAKTEETNSAIYCICEIVSAFSTSGYICYLYKGILESPVVNIYSEFTNIAVAAIAILLGIGVIRFGILKNKASLAISDVGSIALFFLTFIGVDILHKYSNVTNVFGDVVSAKPLVIANLVILILINIAVVFFLSRCTFRMVNRLSAPVWLFTLVISFSTLAVITAILIVQFGLSFSNVIISAVYIAIACLLLAVGFSKNYTVIRSSGLILILIAFAKLCFVDSSRLDSGWKIASYFAFGAVFILISFFYQRFSRKIQNQ